MRYLILILSLGISMLAMAQSSADRMPNEFIVKFKPEAIQNKHFNEFFNNSELRSLNSDLDIVKIQAIKSKHSKGIAVVEFNTSNYTLEDIISRYERTGFFEYVEPNYIATGSGVMNTVPNDARYRDQWALKNDGTFSESPAVSGADIDMELAWDIERGDPDMIVAIIDSGVRLSHPEFSGRIWENPNEVEDGNDSDGNGFVDDLVAGWDFINEDNEPIDDHGHGSNVAGIALASGNNSIGYAGINWNSRVMICKSLDDNNSGSYAAMAGAIYYAVDNGAKVINMSIGGSSPSFTLSNAIDYCHNNGVVLVACMMNFNNDVAYYPAAYPKTIAVGATNPDDTRSVPFFWSLSSGSNFGPHIDIVAPGNYMYGLSHTSDFWYGSYWGGTSQATPLVTGVVSLLLAQKPSLTFDEIRTILTESAEDQVGDASEDIPGFDQYYGHGRLNAYNALTSDLLDAKDVELNGNVLLYPNPMKEGSELRISNLNPGKYKVTLFNSVGQKAFHLDSLRTDNSTLILPISELVKGTYFLNIVNEAKGRIMNKKLIIN